MSVSTIQVAERGGRKKRKARRQTEEESGRQREEEREEATMCAARGWGTIGAKFPNHHRQGRMT